MTKRTYLSFPRSVTLEEAFWARVDPDSGNGCWGWLGSKDVYGYGRVNHSGVTHKAHRLAYTLLAGEIPDGLVLDHLCRNPGCVNPEHLEPVTNAVNVMRGMGAAAQAARQTHCPKNHPYSGDNLYANKGLRLCRTCKREQWRSAAARRRASKATTDC